MSWKRVCSIEVFIEKISPDDIPRDEVPIMEVVGPMLRHDFRMYQKKWQPPNICQKIGIYTSIQIFVGNQPGNPFDSFRNAIFFSDFSVFLQVLVRKFLSRRSSPVGSTRGGKSKTPGLPGEMEWKSTVGFFLFLYHFN